MSNQYKNSKGESAPALLARRKFLTVGASLAAAPLLGDVVTDAQAGPTKDSTGNGPFPARAYGVTNIKEPFKPMQITRRALRPNDVLIDVLYCGICHSDIHIVQNDWGSTNYPCVPGHEMLGRVAAIGNAVTKFKVGDIAGVGCIIDSCGTCEYCLADLEQYCVKGWTLVFNTPDRISGGFNYGGYSDKIVVAERYAIRIPPGMDLAATAPLLCAGITTFSPLQHWNAAAGQRVGVIGLGGLGHMAVKLAVARRADVTVFSTSPGKIDDAKRLGAKEAVLWSDADAMKRLANQFELIIATVPKGFTMDPFVGLLKLDGTLVNVGVLGELERTSGRGLIGRRRNIAGSMVGGIAETQEVIDYCAARNIKADVEVIGPEQINRAYERVVDKDVRYRFVIDLASNKSAENKS